MSWSPFSAHGRGEEGREGWGRDMGEGADTVPLGTFSPSLSFLLSFFLFLFFNSIHPLKITTYEVAKCFLGVMAVAEIKCLKSRLTVKINVSTF